MVDQTAFFVGMDVWIDFHPGNWWLLVGKVKAVRRDFVVLRTPDGSNIYVEYNKLNFIGMCAFIAHYEHSTMML